MIEEELVKRLAEAEFIAGLSAAPNQIASNGSSALPGRSPMPMGQSPRALSPASKKFGDFIRDAVPPTSRLYVTAVLVPERWWGRFSGNTYYGMPPGAVMGCFFGTADVVCYRFKATDVAKNIEPEMVVEIPKAIVDAMVAEEVETELKK